MPLETIIPAPFQHDHEQEMFDHLAQSLRTSIASSPDNYILVGNFHVGGRELDALFIGPGNVTVIEMKSHGGRVSFSENGPWLINGDELRESADGNPFRQVRNYRFELSNFLGRKSGLHRGPEWRRIGTLVLFGRPITLENAIPQELHPWFQIKDLNTVAAALLAKRDPSILKSSAEIERLRSILDLSRVASATPVAVPVPQKFEVPHVRQSEFGPAITAMRASGMELAAAVRVITERIESVKRLPLRNPFSGLPSRIPKEIAGSIA